MKKDKPILFSTDMVRAILAGCKTQTRRITKRDDLFNSGYEYDGVDNKYIKNPYKPGMILWVRETWSREKESDGNDYIIYKADQPKKTGIRWRPSIFMPKDACRLFLEVFKVRAEALQDITDDDIKAEGLTGDRLRDKWIQLWDSINAARGFPWAKNPWVYVIKFKVQAGRRILRAQELT